MRSSLAALAAVTLLALGAATCGGSMNERAYPGPVVAAEGYRADCADDDECVLVGIQPCSCDCRADAAQLAAIHRGDADRHRQRSEAARAECGWTCDNCADGAGAIDGFAAVCEAGRCAVTRADRR